MKTKCFFIAFFTFVSINLLGQNLDECGKDDNHFLTEVEIEFLKEYLKNHTDYVKDFDFRGKKILFVTGSSGMTLGKKSNYFDKIKEWKEKYNTHIQTGLVVLTEEEKIEYGYDAIIYYWVKMLNKTKVLKKAKKASFILE